MPRAPLNGLALDPVEDFELDAASTRASEKWLQAGEGGCSFVIAALGLRAQGLQARSGDVPRAQRCVAGTLRTLFDCLHKPLHSLLLSGGQVRKSRMQVDIRPESGRRYSFEGIGELAPAARVVDAVARQSPQQSRGVARVECRSGAGGEQPCIENGQRRRDVPFLGVEH